MINITIVVSGSKDIASVEVAGKDEALINDKEEDIFQLNTERIKSAFTKHIGGWPENVYLKGPTPFSDVYKINSWSQVKKILYPTKAKIVGLQTKSINLNSKKFVNNETYEKKYDAGISQNTTCTLKHSWKKVGEFSTEKDISYNIQFTKSDTSRTTNYTAKWGEDSIKSQNVSVGNGIAVEVSLLPGKEAMSTLTAMNGTMEIEIEYAATLEGSAVAFYADGHKNKYYWEYDINKLLLKLNLPDRIVSHETIKIDFISDVSTVVTST